MSRIATMASNFRKVKENHRPSEMVMTTTGWKYSTDPKDPSQFIQCQVHRRRHGLAQLSLGRAYLAVRRRTWERLDVKDR